ncbi:RNA-directed DNA polymerase, eukaryota, reverse transcriptase zinc-binding domain protein, partial [Tanacetum coccineum]
VASDMAKSAGYGVANFPLKYLGVPVGCNMSRCVYWNPIIQNFSSKLAQWKARLYLLENEKKITWVKWEKCLASKNLGGLGVGSIYALNLGLLFKWIWRFRCHSNDLWEKVIKSLYGINGGINDDHVFSHSTWGAILSSVKRLKQNGIDLMDLCTRKIGNGALTRSTVSHRLNIRDWSSILRRLPGGGEESSQFNALLSHIGGVVLSDQKDTWESLNTSTGFTVASVRTLIDANTLIVDSIATRWNRCVPIKVNIFLWRLVLNKLATRVNLGRKGIDVDSTLCPICGDDVETVNHIFFLLRDG